MAMTIMNDASASMTLGELNKNISALGKQLKKVSSGQRINGAGDGPSEYSISEKMRVRIRALDQDERNVLNGAALLKTAEGAIQQQIEIMKTIKEKVIDADNDTNTDIDRMTIQKEIDHGYQQIQDIAYETNYNGKRLLVGDTKVDEIYTWKVVVPPETTPGSEMDIIPNAYYWVDGVKDYFDILSSYSEDPKTATIDPLFGSDTRVDLAGGGSANATFTMNFDNYSTVDDLNGLGFVSNSTYGTYYYVLTTTPGQSYRTENLETDPAKSANYVVATEIDISSAGNDFDKALKILAESTKINGLQTKTENGVTKGTGVVSGKTITFTRSMTGTSGNNPSKPWFKGWKAESSTTNVMKADPTGHFTTPGYAQGSDAVQKQIGVDENDFPVYMDDPPATYAILTHDISGVAANSGVTIKDYGSRYAYIKFVEGNEGLKKQDDGSYTVGKNAKVNKQLLSTQSGIEASSDTVWVYFSMSGGEMTLQSYNTGKTYGKITVTDGINRGGDDTWEYQQVKRYEGTVTGPDGGSDGTKAFKLVDLSAYDALSPDDQAVDDFVKYIKGKAITFKYQYSTYYAQTDTKYEFIDKKNPDSMDAVRKTNIDDRYTIDLNQLRKMVGPTTSIADAFISIMKTKNGNYFSDGTDELGKKALKISASRVGENGNKERIEITAAKLGQYTVNFADYFQKTGTTIPDGLDGKGFRIYCATCPDQWFNFQFSAGNEELDDTRPQSGSSGADLKTVMIDIADVTAVGDLVKRFYEKAKPAMDRIMHGQPHTLNLVADYEENTITFYDTRRFELNSSSFPNISEKRVAKLADGVLDDVQKELRGVYVKDLVIQHTDHASQNIHVRIPQTTLDHLFNYIEGTRSISEFNVMTTKSREELLGNVKGERRTGGYTDHEEKGALDTALDYLTSANTLIGAQIMRLEMTQANIVTARESTTNSESTIRDADMAKEMTGYTKANVLAQAAQSMLAQANQNSSGILSLLQ